MKVIGRKLRRMAPGLLAAAFVYLPATSFADTLRIAAAANFADALAELAELYERNTDHAVVTIIGSTGKLYAQILHGAPFHVFLAADQERPRLLEENGLAVAGTRFTYAVGRLVLWSPDSALIGGDANSALVSDTVRHIAIANPELAPYGAAARECLQWLGLWSSVSDKIVMGENIGQAYAMIETGNAEIGFIAQSTYLAMPNEGSGSRWLVPSEAHAPIRQDAVLLRLGEENEAAPAFAAFMKTEAARETIARFGYDVE